MTLSIGVVRSVGVVQEPARQIPLVGLVRPVAVPPRAAKRVLSRAAPSPALSGLALLVANWLRVRLSTVGAESMVATYGAPRVIRAAVRQGVVVRQPCAVVVTGALRPVDAAAGELWSRALDVLRFQVAAANFSTWLDDTLGRCFDGGALVVVCSSLECVEWLTGRVRGVAARAVVQCGGGDGGVVFEVEARRVVDCVRWLPNPALKSPGGFLRYVLERGG